MNQTEIALAAAMNEIDSGQTDYLPTPPMTLLRERVVSAIENVAFYRRLYLPFGPVPEGDGFLKWFAELPIVNKSTLQAAREEELLNPLYDRTRLVKRPTSGSSGIPFVLHLDNRVFLFRKFRFQRPHQRLSHGSPTRLAYLFPWDFVVKTPREERHMASDGGHEVRTDREVRLEDRDQKQQKQTFTAVPMAKKTPAGASSPVTTGSIDPDRPVTINSFLPPSQIFELISELRPVTLIGFASVLAALARWMVKENVRLPSVRNVWTTSELLSLEGADAIRRAIGCEPLVIYASNEFGFMAWQAEKDAPLRFESDRLYLESVDGPRATGAEGQLSRIIVTDLLNDTMPLIRYDIGDLARVHEPVRATDTLHCATLSDLQGKEADLIEGPDGRTITTFQVLGAIKDFLPNAQYRVICLEAGRYLVQYRPGVDFVRANVDGVVAELRKIFGEGVEILVHETDVIEREPSGKLRPVVNLARVSPLKRRDLAGKLGVLPFLKVDEAGIARSTVASVLAKVLPSHVGRGELDESKELYADLGMSSIHFAQLLTMLEAQLGREIDDEALLDANLISVGDLVSFVLDQIKS